MPRRRTMLPDRPERQSRQDFELCKVVFGAAVSQILYSRRAFPPECFQLLPLQQVVSRSFEDIVTSGSGIQLYDIELLRDQENTVFLRQGTAYGVCRFLGILREDIFPLIQNQGLVKFRISYLKNQTWGGDCLAEYYTVVFKYEHDGRYILDVWRAGTGRQHIATTDRQLWNLGDYLSRLTSRTDFTHWTLAFHATERPDDPPIGVWRFDRSAFDDANLKLQQRDGYSYARIVRFEIMPQPLTDTEEEVVRSSPEFEFDSPWRPDTQLAKPNTTDASKHAKKKRGTQNPKPKNNTKSTSRNLRTGEGQLSPPLTLASSRNASQKTTMDNNRGGSIKSDSSNEQILHVAEGAGRLAAKQRTVPKRKAKKPMQIFEDGDASLVMERGSRGPSQKLSPAIGGQLAVQDDESGMTRMGCSTSYIPRSPSPNPLKLLEGISLSPDGVSTIPDSPQLGLPLLRPPVQSASLGASQQPSNDVLQASPLPSMSPDPCEALQRLSQGEFHALPPSNLFDVDLSDDEANMETAFETEPQNPSCTSVGAGEDSNTKYDFSPNTVARRTLLFHGIPESSDSEL